MRILYGTEQPFPLARADTEQIVNTVAALGRRGVDVELLIRQENGTVTSQQLREFYHVEGEFQLTLVKSSFDSVHALQKVAHSLRVSKHPRSAEADLVYTRSLGTVITCLLRGRRVALDAYRPWPRQYPSLKLPLRWMMRHKNFLGAVLHSDFARESYVDIGIPEERLIVAHNGYEPARFEPRLEASEARAKVGLADRPTVVYAGKINEKKGLGVVLDMARRLPDVQFVLVGSEGEGPIESAAAELDNVVIVPRQDSRELPTYLYAADVLIIPPSADPLTKFGNTVLPIKLFIYLAAGRVILAPRAPDTAELLEHDVNAVLVEPGDADAAAAALAEVLADADRREQLRSAAHEVGQSLTWDARAEKIQSFLAERLDQAS